MPLYWWPIVISHLSREWKNSKRFLEKRKKRKKKEKKSRSGGLKNKLQNTSTQWKWLRDNNSNSQQVASTCCVLGTVLRALCSLTHLVLIASLWSRFYYFPILKVRHWCTENLSNIPKIFQLVQAGWCLSPRKVNSQNFSPTGRQPFPSFVLLCAPSA